MSQQCVPVAKKANGVCPAGRGTTSKVGLCCKYERLHSDQRVGPVLSTWDLLGSALCSWKSSASASHLLVKLGSNGSESILYYFTYRQFCKKMQRATQCQEKGSNHYPVTAKWGRLERRVRILSQDLCIFGSRTPSDSAAIFLFKSP